MNDGTACPYEAAVNAHKEAACGNYSYRVVKEYDPTSPTPWFAGFCDHEDVLKIYPDGNTDGVFIKELTECPKLTRQRVMEEKKARRNSNG
jgi:hypothetical protein